MFGLTLDRIEHPRQRGSPGRRLGVETPILNLVRTHVAAYEIGRTGVAATS
jgi:hypothetical protein